MSIQAVAWALEQQIPAGPKLVLVALANHADHSTGLCWPSVELIAHQASCVPRSVYRYVADLARNGYVAVEKKRARNGKQRANNYWLLFTRLPLAWSAVPGQPAQDADEDSIDGQDVVGGEDSSIVHVDEPGDTLSPGGSEPPDNTEMTMTPRVMTQRGDTESPGPGDSGVTRKSLLEPSCVEPSGRPALAVPLVPHGYDRTARPSAQQASEAEEARRRAAPVFVIEGTRAYRLWQAEKERQLGRKWNLVTTIVSDGRARRGWYFPTLFPGDPPPTERERQDSDALIDF